MVTQWLSDDNESDQDVQNCLIVYLSQAQTHTSYSLRSDSEIQCYVCWIHTIMFKSRKKESDLLMTLTLWSEYNSSTSTAHFKKKTDIIHYNLLRMFCSLNISLCKECHVLFIEHSHVWRVLHACTQYKNTAFHLSCTFLAFMFAFQLLKSWHFSTHSLIYISTCIISYI